MDRDEQQRFHRIPGWPERAILRGRSGRMTIALFACALVSGIVTADLLLSQDDSSVRPPEPTPAPSRSITELDSLRPGRSVLLREGSVLRQAQGSVVYEEADASWRFIIESKSDQTPDYQLRLLPNAALAELKQVLEATADRRIAFELTGRVFVFHDENYLLLTAPARVVETPEGPADEAAPATVDQASDDGEDDDRPTTTRSARDVMRELERASGPVQRTNVMPGRTATMADNLAREGTIILARRGKVSREASGAWQFVFDADASGRADPPLILLPCLLLERIEDLAQRRGIATPMLISGEVTAFEGRNYLQPTSFQIPLERTPLNP